MNIKISHLKVSERKVLLRTFDLMFITVSLFFANTYFNFSYLNFINPNIYLWLVTLSLYFSLFGEIFQLYNLGVSNNRFKVVQSVFLSSVITTFFFTFTPYFSPSLPEDRIQIIILFSIVFISVLIWRFLYLILLFKPKYFKDIIIITHSSKLDELKKLITNDGIHNVVEYYSEKNSINGYKSASNIELYSFVKKNHITEIIISTKGFETETIEKLNKDIILLFEEGYSIKSYETFYEEITQSIPREYLDPNFYKKINLSKNNDSRFYNFFHRVLDILVSIIGISVFAFLFPIIIIMNLIGNRGSIFYTQTRVGEKGKVFKIFKLRTMIPNAEKDGIAFTVKNDKRITLFGKFLRNTRIDEMPQFINILKGDMSIIGPRPERPEFVKLLEEKIPFYALRNVVKPGLTGWAQVCYPYAGTIEEQEEKLRYDLYYIKEQSPFLDFKIIIKTITTILLFRGQ